MGMALRRLGSHGVNLVVLHGGVDRSELIGFYRGIDPEDPANAMPWLTYIAQDADLSEIDIAAFAELRRIWEPIRQAAERKGDFSSVVVSGSEQSDALVEFWRNFVAKESGHPPYTILFSDVKKACRELNLPDSAPDAIVSAAQSILARVELRPARPVASGMSKLEAFFNSATGQAVLNAFAESTPTMLAVADCEGKILRESRFAAVVTGWVGALAHEAGGLTVAQYLERNEVTDLQGRPLEAKDTSLVRALKGKRVCGLEGFLVTRQGERIPFISNGAPIQTADGEVIGAIAVTTDLRRQKALENELRAAVAEKEMLYRELAHRAKNHLHVLSGLLKLEAREASTAAEVAERMSGRLKLLAGIYDRMIQAEISGRVPARAFAEDVVALYRTASVSIDVAAPEDLTLPPGAAGPFGMLVNEAVANSYKHAFPGRSGRIEVSLRASGPGRLELTIADDGIGWKAPTDRPSQGLKLMRLLAQQLGGELEMSDRAGGGAQIVVKLPDLSEPGRAHGESARPEAGGA